MDAASLHRKRRRDAHDADGTESTTSLSSSGGNGASSRSSVDSSDVIAVDTAAEGGSDSHDGDHDERVDAGSVGAASNNAAAPQQRPSWRGIIGLDDAKRALFEACMLPALLPPHLLRGIRAVPTSVLLYGPPG